MNSPATWVVTLPTVTVVAVTPVWSLNADAGMGGTVPVDAEVVAELVDEQADSTQAAAARTIPTARTAARRDREGTFSRRFMIPPGHSCAQCAGPTVPSRRSDQGTLTGGGPFRPGPGHRRPASGGHGAWGNPRGPMRPRVVGGGLRSSQGRELT